MNINYEVMPGLLISGNGIQELGIVTEIQSEVYSPIPFTCFELVILLFSARHEVPLPDDKLPYNCTA